MRIQTNDDAKIIWQHDQHDQHDQGGWKVDYHAQMKDSLMEIQYTSFIGR